MSIDQITTIADLCEFITTMDDLPIKVDQMMPVMYSLSLHEYAIVEDPGNNRLSDSVQSDEVYYREDDLITRLFDLDVFGWSYSHMGVDFAYTSFGKEIRLSITLTREKI